MVSKIGQVPIIENKIMAEVLLNALSNNTNVRNQAEKRLKQFEEENLPSFLFSLSCQLAIYQRSVSTRMLAGLILKNALDAKDKHRKSELVHRWLSLDVTVKTQIKTKLLNTLYSSKLNFRSISSQVIAKIAGIELPHKQWPELIDSLLLDVHQPFWTLVALEALGYICEEVSPDVIDKEQVNRILTALLEGMVNSSPICNDVRLAATRSLNNALGFAQANFSNDMEQNDIIVVVLMATLSSEVVRCSTDETAPMVLQLVPVIVMELHTTLEGQKLSSYKRERQCLLQGSLWVFTGSYSVARIIRAHKGCLYAVCRPDDGTFHEGLGL